MVDSSIMDKALVQLNERYPNPLNIKESLSTFHNVNDESQNYLWREVTDIFLSDEIVEYATDKNNPTIIRLTQKGRDIIKEGNYDKYLEKKDKRLKRQKEIEELTHKKLEYDVANSKRIFKTYWFTFSFALIGLVISLILLVLKLIDLSK